MIKLKDFFKVKSDYYAGVLTVLAILLLVLGIGSIFVRQPASWYDEEIHYVRSLQIANGDILRTKNNDNTKYGGVISINQNKFIDKAFQNKLFDKKIQAIDINWEKNYTNLSYTPKQVYRISVTAVNYMPFQYFPFVLASFLSKILKFNVSTEFILMRFFGFMVSYILILFAVRKLPFGKLTLILLALCPPYFLSISSVTADSFVFGMIPLFLAYVVSIFYSIADSAKISKNELVKFSIVSLALTLAKPPACLLISLVLVIAIVGRIKKIFDNRSFLALIVLICALAFITLFWLYTVRMVDGRAYFGITDADSSGQIKFILSHPVLAIKVFIKEISNFDFTYMQLGYADKTKYMQLPRSASFFYVIAIFSSIFIGEKEIGNLIKSKYIKIFNFYKIFLFIIIVIISFAVLYLQFTPVASDVILGVQQRYFLPYWLLLLLVLPKFTTLDKKIITGVVASGLVPVVYYLLFTMVQL